MRSLPIRIETLAVLILPTGSLAVTKVENLGGMGRSDKMLAPKISSNPNDSFVRYVCVYFRVCVKPTLCAVGCAM